jgi:6-phosphogluconate dehydrogenase
VRKRDGSGREAKGGEGAKHGPIVRPGQDRNSWGQTPALEAVTARTS